MNFKFFEGKTTKRRVFTDFMDALDDYHLGNIQPTHHLEVPGPRLRPFTLNVHTEVFGRIPSYALAFEPSNIDDYEVIRGTTIGQFIGGELNIPWCFTELSITRISDNSHISIHYQNVEEMDRRALIFDSQDMVTICYKSN
jgi:hypothetical protein